jgi:hypothetical protein
MRPRTRIPQNRLAIHRAFKPACGIFGKETTEQAQFNLISFFPESHSRDIENSPLVQPFVFLFFQKNFHFSFNNDGYYYSFFLLLILFPLSVTDILPAKLCGETLPETQNTSASSFSARLK